MTNPKRSKAVRLREKAELLKALAHPTRLAIVQELVNGPKCVTDIQELLDAPQSNISQHLTVLRSYRIVNYHEDGKLRCYYVTRPALAELIECFLRTEFPIVERSQDEVRRSGRRRKESQVCKASK
jgi:ArsR family transcriptional regulator, arsenate/arsenite/antimonite-responsive transcriptional repressor